MRINRFLASAGFGSRRKCEDLVRAGSVYINGKVNVNLSAAVDGESDVVTVDGIRAVPRVGTRIFVLNKPVGVLCTVSDDMKRKTVLDIAAEKGYGRGLFPVGRLDMYTSGIILLTDDGDLTYRLTHPRFKIDKVYIVKVAGDVRDSEIARIASGIDLDGQKTGPCAIAVLERNKSETIVEVVLREGRNRQIRRSFMEIGHKVRRLHRKALGELEFKDLAEGDMRPLSAREEKILRRQTGLSQGVGK